MDAILAQALNGDREAENKVFERLLVRFTMIARHHLGEDRAADAAQSACVIVLEKYRTQVFTKSFESWSYGIIRNVIRQVLDRQTVEDRYLTHSEDHESPDSKAVDTQLRLHLEGCLKEMSIHFPKYLKILNLVLEGYSREDISVMLDIKPDTLNTYVNRGRTILFDCLEKKRGVRE